MAKPKNPWDLWLGVAKGNSMLSDNTGLMKETAKTGTIPWNTVENLIKDFQGFIQTQMAPQMAASTVFEITDPAAVYVAAHHGSHPDDSIAEVLMMTYSEQSLKETKVLLRETAGINDIDPRKRTGQNALKTTAEDIVKGIGKLLSSANVDKYRFVLKAEDLAGSPKFAPEELTNNVDLVRRMRNIEVELRNLSVNVASNTEKIENGGSKHAGESASQSAKSNWANVAKSHAAKGLIPPQISRIVNSDKNRSPSRDKAGTMERAGRSGSAKRRRVSEADASDVEDSASVREESPFRTDGHSKKDRRAKKKSIQGKREGGKLVGGTEEVEIVIAGIRKTQNIEAIISYVNETGTNEGHTIGLTNDKCELLEPKDKNKPPPKTLTMKCTVKRELKSVLLSADFWPRGIYVREFVRFRPKEVGASFDQNKDSQGMDE